MYGQRTGPKRSDIGQQSSHQHADWYDQYIHCLLSLLTSPRPTSSPPLVAEVQEPSATLPPSALHAASPSPVPPPGLVPKRLRRQHEGWFSLSHPRYPSLAEHFFDGSEHRARTLAAHIPLPFDWVTLLSKEAPASPSTRPPSPVPSSLRIPSHH